MDVEERRSFRRIPLSSRGCVIFEGIDFDVRTHDISEGGVLVEFDAAYPVLMVGMKLRVYLTAGFIGRGVVCRTVVGKNCALYGLKFDRFDFRTDRVLGVFLAKLESGLPETVTIH